MIEESACAQPAAKEFEPMKDAQRHLMWHGMLLFLLGLLTGFAETSFANVQWGLSLIWNA
jgi:hypothetical protein